MAALRAWTLLDALPPLDANPYENPEAWPLREGTVCAVRVVDAEAKTYRLETWDSAGEAAQANAIMTHEGGCGRCSDLESLALYAEVGDLTQPVRQCGVEALLSGEERGRACLREISFHEACAESWYWNTVHTRQACQRICLQQLSQPYHRSDGSLSACLQCDEDQSAPLHMPWLSMHPQTQPTFKLKLNQHFTSTSTHQVMLLNMRGSW